MPTKLNDAFKTTIDRIRGQPDVKSQQGMEILQWIYLAERQLTIDQLRHALAANDPTMVTLDQDDLPFARSLLDYCFGLVVLDQETSLIRLVHKSLQDFLDSNKEKHDLFVNGHRDIARSCLTYISFLDSTTTSDPEKDRDVFCDIRYERQSPESSHIQKYPFITYAVHHWGHHATIQTDQEVTDLASALSPNNRTPQCISHKIRHSLFTATKTSYVSW